MEYADNLIKNFIENTKILYGEQFITHNFHGLCHLTDCFKEFGPMDSGSAFPFENFLQFFKRLLRKGDKPLEQVVRRCSEILKSNHWFDSSLPTNIDSYPNLSQPHYHGPVLPTSDVSQQFSLIELHHFSISIRSPNNCCFLSHGSVVVVENIVFSNDMQKFVIVCREFLDKSDFYSNPFISSSELGIFILSNLSPLQEVAIDSIAGKIVLMPFKDKAVGVPLLHSHQ